MNKGPSLAVLVKKWLKTYSTKSQWEFSFAYDPKTKEQDLNEGYLTCYRIGEGPGRLAIMIKGDYAVIGQLGSGTYSWQQKAWTENLYSGVKMIAADPRFFPKLDKAMQFLVRSKERRAEHDKIFAQEETTRLREILK